MRQLPPLSIPVLQLVEEAEALAEGIVATCGGADFHNHHKVLRAFNACAIQIFDIEVAYYLSSTDPDPDWPSGIVDQIAASLIALLNNPKYVYYQDSVRMEIGRVLQQHLTTWRLSSTVSAAQSPLRKGYRTEILKWMASKDLSTVAQVAKKLGVSRSTLKSIMSTKGKPRYGTETLERILAEIGYTERGE